MFGRQRTRFLVSVRHLGDRKSAQKPKYGIECLDERCQRGPRRCYATPVGCGVPSCPVIALAATRLDKRASEAPPRGGIGQLLMGSG